MKSIKVILSVMMLLVVSGCIYRMENAPPDSDNRNLAEHLGYEANTKLLIVNSDDTGANQAFSHGAYEVMAAGLVKSTSVSVTDRNDQELAKVGEVAKAHPEWGFGLHLMLTNEYQDTFPWGPVLTQNQVPTLYNDKGLSWEKISQVEKYVDPKEAAIEFEAQLLKALSFGIPITHIDSHMGAYYRNSRFSGSDKGALRKAAIGLAAKYNLPMTVNTFDKDFEPETKYIDKLGIIRPDTFFGFYELEEMNSHLSYEGNFFKRWVTALVVKSKFGFQLPYANEVETEKDVKIRMEIYKQAILNVVQPGLNHIYIHASVEKATNGDTIPRGKNHDPGEDRIVRLGDTVVWSSQEMREFLKANNIVMINYSDLKKIQEKKRNKSSLK